MTPIAKDHLLKIIDHRKGFAVLASKENAEALQLLFHQYEINCRHVEGREKDTLEFDATADREKVEQILLEYEASET